MTAATVRRPGKWADRFSHLIFDVDIEAAHEPVSPEIALEGGWAAGLERRRELLSFLPPPDDDNPPYCVADAWQPRPVCCRASDARRRLGGVYSVTWLGHRGAGDLNHEILPTRRSVPYLNGPPAALRRP